MTSCKREKRESVFLDAPDSLFPFESIQYEKVPASVFYQDDGSWTARYEMRPYIYNKFYPSDSTCVYDIFAYGDYSPYKAYEDSMRSFLNEHSMSLDSVEEEDECYFEAALSSEIRIIANKKLFGREAGSNLADKFYVTSLSKNRYRSVYVYQRRLDMSVISYLPDKLPMSLDKFLCPGGLLPPISSFTFVEQPEEKYSEVSFKLVLSVHSVNHEKWVLDTSNPFYHSFPNDREVYAVFTVRENHVNGEEWF